MAQSSPRIHTRPTVPSDDVLKRLNLELGWRTNVPTDGVRDGLFSVQVRGDQLLVQTHSGSITAYNADTGVVQWRRRVGEPYRVSQPLAVNKSSVFAYSGLRLVALDRKTGQVQWEMPMPDGPSAPVAADEERVYLACGSGRLYVYELPPPGLRANPVPSALKEKSDQAAPVSFYQQTLSSLYGGRSKGYATVGPLVSVRGGNELRIGPQPLFLWDYLVTGRLENAPLLYEGLLILADHEGDFFVIPKLGHEPKFTFNSATPLSAPMEQYNDMAYIPSLNFHVFALNIPLGRIEWRLTTGRPILGKPVATDEDLYVVANGTGLSRVDRSTGHELWRNRSVARFLASSKNFVYAADKRGSLLILDRVRGTELAEYDVRDFNVPVRNDVTDRLYLAANNGLLVCLHDPANPTPVLQRRAIERSAADDKAPRPAPKKPPADKAEAEKEPDK
jgi:outer membrane protein assembly factor BamB